jgi:uncharacterized protein (TIGR02996 family)
MESKGEVGVCPVCGGPTRKADWGTYQTAEEGQEMELCWNQCYYHLNDYGEHLLRVGDQEWRWGSFPDSPEKSDRPSEEINRAIEELKVKRLARYKEPEALRFLAVLDKDRFDKVTRTVFSDWLEEHGYDDEAVFQRNWTREWQEAWDHLFLCAAECRIAYDELLNAATDYLEGKEGDYGATLFLGHLTPEIMYDTETFWRAYRTVTGRDVSGDPGSFVLCAC